MSKWINKRRQALDEKLNKSTDKTELPPSFLDLEKQTDATRKAIDNIVGAIPNFLHPNPAARAARTMNTAMAKLTKTAAEKRYPHSTGELGEIFVKAASEMDPESDFGRGLEETGEAFNQICEGQHALDSDVNHNFLEPLKQILEKEMKDILHFRKKLEGRRLDYDFKRRKAPESGGKISAAEVRAAEDKFDETRGIYEASMISLLDNDVEQVSQLAAFVEANLRFYRSSADLLQRVYDGLQRKIAAAGDRPKRAAEAAAGGAGRHYDSDDDAPVPVTKAAPAPAARGGLAAGASISKKTPQARALFDFDAENDGELSFKEGQTIRLLSRVDENWLEGEVGGKSGLFPSNYVDVIVDF